jgi:ElaB/YqjD/DUF883 family membrane-anchored ribosome-binding protein
MAVEKHLEQLLKDIQKGSDDIRRKLKALNSDDRRSNRVARLAKELDILIRLFQHWRKQAYNIDRSIRENIAAALVSSNEDVRKRGQQHHRKKRKEK